MTPDLLEHRLQDCVACGKCLSECPVMGLPLETARVERRRLVRGARSSLVLDRCTSCLSCHARCPQACRPAHLNMARWHDTYLERGLPRRADWYDPNHSPNFRTFVVDRLPDDEKALVEQWADTSRAEEILFPGCNVLTVPYLLRTRLVEDLPVRGALGLCCGETYYRMGLIEPLRETAGKLEQAFAAMGVRRMVIPCTAGYNMFTNILPRVGARFTFEVEHLLARLARRVERGDITIGRPLDLVVTVQDSCHAKVLGDTFVALPRRLLDAMGVRVIEQRLSRDRALCCGIGGGFSASSAYHPARIARATYRALESARATGADAILVYCAGCLQMLATGMLLFPFLRRPIYHILELVQLATGERPLRRHFARARVMMAGVIRHQVPALISAKRSMVSTGGTEPAGQDVDGG